VYSKRVDNLMSGKNSAFSQEHNTKDKNTPVTIHNAKITTAASPP
jgi:hypothetical protein